MCLSLKRRLSWLAALAILATCAGCAELDQEQAPKRQTEAGGGRDAYVLAADAPDQFTPSVVVPLKFSLALSPGVDVRAVVVSLTEDQVGKLLATGCRVLGESYSLQFYAPKVEFFFNARPAEQPSLVEPPAGGDALELRRNYRIHGVLNSDAFRLADTNAFTGGLIAADFDHVRWRTYRCRMQIDITAEIPDDSPSRIDFRGAAKILIEQRNRFNDDTYFQPLKNIPPDFDRTLQTPLENLLLDAYSPSFKENGITATKP
jgi:hypothetical protein